MPDYVAEALAIARDIDIDAVWAKSRFDAILVTSEYAELVKDALGPLYDAEDPPSPPVNWTRIIVRERKV